MGQVLLFMVLPETMLIFGFVIAILILLGAGLL
jgi:F0F1-type ATP synthase membrane subunit c/vacuolar-type H+-ATPase subunit K